LSVGGILPAVGCQAEYAGMTLPSGKYMHDDVQYFAPGPDFPWANTQAATQRARMQAMGLDVPPVEVGPLGAPRAAGMLPIGNANQAGGVPNINNQINEPGDGNAPAMGGAAPGEDTAPGRRIPPPPPPGDGATPPGTGGSNDEPSAPPR
jgi:hypothetical protein